MIGSRMAPGCSMVDRSGPNRLMITGKPDYAIGEPVFGGRDTTFEPCHPNDCIACGYDANVIAMS